MTGKKYLMFRQESGSADAGGEGKGEIVETSLDSWFCGWDRYGAGGGEGQRGREEQAGEGVDEGCGDVEGREGELMVRRAELYASSDFMRVHTLAEVQYWR